MATPSPESQWTEADYRKAGFRKLGVRVSELAHVQLAELSEELGASRGAILEDLIQAAYSRLERK